METHASAGLYPGLPAQKRYYPFRHTFPSSGRDVYRQFAASPKANTEVTDLAIDYINTLRMGSRGDAIDMLCVGLTAAPFKYVKDGDYRLELADTYLRLDRDIERLLHAVDKAVVSGTPSYLSHPQDIMMMPHTLTPNTRSRAASSRPNARYRY